ncbi:tetratricopeptide repeat protein [soil metagenome]
MRLFIVHTLLLLAFVAARAQETVDLNTIFTAASDSYVAKDYQAAINGYEQILATGVLSPELYYNLGNAYFRVGHMGLAILNYERALKMQPSLEDAAFNLKLANLRISDRVNPASEFILVSWYKSFIHSRSSSGWGMWALGAIWFALVWGAVYIFSRLLWLRRLSFGIMGLLLVASVVVLLFARMQYQYELSTNEGIIIVTNTYVKAAPEQSSTDLFILREGTKVTLLETEGGWQKVKVPDETGDKVGWVQVDVLGMI